MDFKVITLDKPQEWEYILSRVKTYDFYHTASYHRLDKSGDSKLLVFQEGNEVMALPLIVRKIKDTPFQDVTSVYGYGGWIRSQAANLPDVSEILRDYFHKEKIVSAFSRIHPIIEGAGLFPVGTVEDSNLTSGIDLLQEPLVQRENYSRSVKRAINKGRKSGIQVRISKSMDDARLFSVIYQNAMLRLNAPAHLFFPSDYFEYLVQSNDFDAFVLLAELSGKIIGGAMFVVCNEFMEYHLGAMIDTYKQYSPIKLLIDEARLIGNEKKLSILHLGGGYGGQNDNLYTFKQRMSSQTFMFKTWKWIVNEDIYNELSSGKNNTNYFPLYRAGNKRKNEYATTY